MKQVIYRKKLYSIDRNKQDVLQVLTIQGKTGRNENESNEKSF